MTHPEPRRRAKIRLTEAHIRGLLDLPDDWQIAAVDASNDPISFGVIVEGESIDPIWPDVCAPYLDGSLTRESVIVEGRIFSRYLWSPVDVPKQETTA